MKKKTMEALEISRALLLQSLLETKNASFFFACLVPANYIVMVVSSSIWWWGTGGYAGQRGKPLVYWSRKDGNLCKTAYDK